MNPEKLADVNQYIQSTCRSMVGTPKQRATEAAWYLGVVVCQEYGEKALSLNELKAALA